MNKISNDEVEKILQDDYKYLQTLFPQDQIFGIFTYGDFNYGFAETIKDLKVKMYYLPTLEEMCTNLVLKNETIEYNNHTINIKDIRLILDNILKQEGTVMECFFAEHNIITPKFKKVYMDTIASKREEIFRCSPRARIEYAVKQAYEEIQDFLKTNNYNSLFNACRRRLCSQLYLNGELVEDCICFKKDYHITYLWNIKKGISLPNMDEVTSDLEEMKAKAETLENHPELEQLVKDTIVNIIKIALIKTIDAKEFLQNLTKPEKDALKIIMQNIKDGEGIVSISQAVNSSNLSRPVFKSVLNKMKDLEIAELTNMGVKGTHVKIIDGVFLNIDDYID